ncbi:MAG: drug:proton antiporter [Gammaproteobacteria bacterium]|nr:MAG: drug:proton antiporter [Gammaproteobacteria bacterium]
MSNPPKNDAMVVFSPSGKRGRFPLSTPVLNAAQKLGVDVDSVCGGRAICGRCQVEVSEGEFAKHKIVSKAESLSSRGEAEQRFASRRGLADNRRLSCQATLRADVVIDVPASSQVHHQVVRKNHEAHDIDINPVVHAYFVEVAQPDMHVPSGDLQRLLAALRTEWQLDNLRCEINVIQTLQTCLRAGAWQVTVAIRNGEQIIAVWPGFRERLYGIAVDVGSTTIAAHLCDLTSGDVLASAGKMNPQIRFGEDLMSRVSYIMMNPGGEADLIRTVREAISELAADVSAQAQIESTDVVEMTVVGNPIMQHLVLGINPVELGTAPFALANDAAVDVLATDIGITINPGGHVYALPCIAGHVGADCAGVLLAESPYDRDEVSLIVDIGTNAEIIVGNRDRLLAASSPTGPAFEGAQISAGQRAAPGAIERVRIDRQTLEPKFKVIGCDLWSDDPLFAEHVSSSGITGICGSGIIEVVAEMYLAGVIDQNGKILGDAGSRSARIIEDGRTFAYVLHDGQPTIHISQNDVRAIQLAKAALYAGARLLMEQFGVDKVDRIRLAGAFGAHIDGKYAMVLGLIPDCDIEQVSSAGNAAGTGARIALLDRNARSHIEAQVRQIEKVETAVAEGFQDHFVAAMTIPHQTDEFGELSRTVELPANKEVRPTGGRKRRAR